MFSTTGLMLKDKRRAVSSPAILNFVIYIHDIIPIMREFLMPCLRPHPPISNGVPECNPWKTFEILLMHASEFYNISSTRMNTMQVKVFAQKLKFHRAL
jgi:hypothetical protein